MVGFTKAVSGDACLQRLTEIEQGLAQNKRIDTSLAQSNKNIIFDLWTKYVVRPLYSLVGWEYSATFRAKNVAASILNFCQANQEYVKEKPDITEKAISIINTLDTKTKQKYHNDLETSKTEIAKITATPQSQDPQSQDEQNLAPQPPAPPADTAKKDVPQDVSSASAQPQDQVSVPAATSAPAQAPVNESAKDANPVDAPADKPATEVAKDANAVASEILGTPVSAKDPSAVTAKTPATPAVANEQAAAVKTPIAPPVNITVSLSPADQAQVDARLQAATAQLGYNTMLQFIHNDAKSICLSPASLMEMMEVLALGMTEKREYNALRTKLQLHRVNNDGIAPRLVALRNALKDQGIDVLTAVLSRDKFDDEEEDEKFTQKIKDFGIPVFEPIAGTRKEPSQTVRAQFAKYIKEVLEHDKAMPDIMHNKWSQPTLAPKLGYNISTVANVHPLVAIEPTGVAKDQTFTFSNNSKTKVDLYTFENVNVIETDDFSMALVPYQTEDGKPTLSKLVFVPKDFANFASRVTPGFVQKCLEELLASNQTMQLEMPQTDIQARHRDLLDLYTSKESSSDVKLPVKHLVGYETTSLMHNVYFSETFYDVVAKEEEKKDETVAPADAAAAPVQAPKTMKVNQSYYYLVLSDNKNVVLQGCVDSTEGLSFKYSARDV